MFRPRDFPAVVALAYLPRHPLKVSGIESVYLFSRPLETPDDFVELAVSFHKLPFEPQAAQSSIIGLAPLGLARPSFLIRLNVLLRLKPYY